MFDLLEEWRARLQGRPVTTPERETDHEREARPGAPSRRLEDFGPCPSCGGGREVVMKPVARDSARMGLMCTSCGTSTGI